MVPDVEATLITVRYVGLARNLAGCNEEQIAITIGTTVRVLIQSLSKKHGDDFGSNILAYDRTLRRTARVMLNDMDVTEMGGLDTRISGGTTVSILVMLAPLAGG